MGWGGIFKIVEAIKSCSKKENSIGSVVSGQTNKKHTTVYYRMKFYVQRLL